MSQNESVRGFVAKDTGAGLISIPSPDDSISLSKAGAITGSSPRRIKDWIVSGVKLKNGARLKLRAFRLPRGFRTTREWIAEFVQALTDDRTGQGTVPAAVEERAARADQVLAASGW
jgi:hypothetical protein